jgi:hypothetical protein
VVGGVGAVIFIREPAGLEAGGNHLPMKMELIEGFETSAYTNQAPGNYPKENLLYSEHGESLKSRLRTCLQILHAVMLIIQELKMHCYPTS